MGSASFMKVDEVAQELGVSKIDIDISLSVSFNYEVKDFASGLKRLALLLKQQDKIALNKKNLISIINPKSPFVRKSIKTIYDELQFNLNDLNGSTRVRTLYKEWDRVFGTMYGEDDEATSFTEVSSVIKETYGYSEDVTIDSKVYLFALQTFFNMFLKLLIYSFLAQLVSPTFKAESLTKPQIDKLFDGELNKYESLVNNFFESHFMEWFTYTCSESKFDTTVVNNINVLDENGNDLNINPISLFDGVQYFGQKDLSSSADHENGLLEKLISGRIGKPSNLDSCVNELVRTVEQLLDVSKIPQQMTEVTTLQTELEHKLSIFEEKGVAEKLKKQSGYATDTTKLDAVKNRIDAILRDIRNAFSKNAVASNALDGYCSDFNKDILDDVFVVLSLIDAQLTQIGSCIAEIEKQYSCMKDIISHLKERTNSLADEFAEIKREIKDETLDVDSFVRMTAELQKTKEKLKQLSEEASSKSKIEASFTKAIRERNDALLTTYNDYKAETDRINQNQTELRIEITFKGDREGFKSQLKNDFKGTGISDAKYQAISDAFTDYAAIIEDWIICDGNKLKSIVTSGEYVKLEDKLRSQYEELLSRQVENKVDIYYHSKLLRQHSIGQRASALILFILTQDDNDIIFIDQPEDDLDNKVIYDEVITAITQKKPYMQFIFATHNANIPVLGDSERVLVVEFQGTKIDVAQGNIDLDSTHKQIVDIMEGGKEAFNKRQLIYTSWS